MSSDTPSNTGPWSEPIQINASQAPSPQFSSDSIAPRPSSIVEITRLRLREVKPISDRLGRMSKWRWDRFWIAASLLLFGTVGGGALALIPFRATTPPPSDRSLTEYYVALGVGTILAIICGLAGLSVKSEREDSVEAIKTDLDTLLDAYPDPEEPSGEPT